MRVPVIWLTGLSGAGKTTIAEAFVRMVRDVAREPVVLLDGDSLRAGLCANLGFTPENRAENVRRAGEVARLISESGITCIVAMISPYRADRELVRSMFPAGFFLETFVNTPMSVCEQRDPKGLYARARAGSILNFTGVSAPYEAPTNPEIELRPEQQSVSECVYTIFRRLNGNHD